MTAKLIAYWGGRAATGATYEIEVTDEAGHLTVTPLSAGIGAARKQQGILYSGPNRLDAYRVLMAQATKKRAGRERAYTDRMSGDPCSSVWVKTVLTNNELPDHDQVWVEGRPLTTLPAALHHRVTATATSTPCAVPAPVVTLPQPESRTRVALCERANDVQAQAMIDDDAWIATRKVEGQRAQLHTRAGGVTMTNRSGSAIPCPPHIAAVAVHLPDGTSLDGEVVAVTSTGREGLYAGAAATHQVFIAFDIVAEHTRPDVVSEPQHVRFGALGRVVAGLGHDQTTIRVVETAFRTAEKQVLVERARQDGWEGLVFRHANAAYPQGRTAAWIKYKLRYETLDVVVMRYQAGKGRLKHSVGAVEVGLYNDQDELVAIGEVGSGWSDAQRAELQRRRDAGETGYVIEVKAEGFTAGKKLLRPIAVAIRPDGDKPAIECRLAA